MASSILNYMRTTSVLGWAKDLIFDKAITYTMKRQEYLEQFADKKVLLLPVKSDAGVSGQDIRKKNLPNYLKSSDGANVRAPRVDTDHIWSGSFIETYGIDGLDLPSARITHDSGDKSIRNRKENARFEGSQLPAFLYFIMFLGLPSRVLFDKSGKINYSWQQFWHALIGGWDSTHDEIKNLAKKKNWWNRFFLVVPFKELIAVYYIVTTIFIKLPINIIKFPAVMLPLVIKSYTAVLTGWLTYKSTSNLTSPGVFTKLAGVALGLISVITFAVNTAVRLATVVLRAFFAPETNARLFWREGLTIENKPLAFIVALVGVLASIALTTALWIIAFPVIITIATNLFPFLVPVMASLSQLPIIATSLVAIKGGFALAVGSLPAAFTSAAAWLAGLAGLSLTTPAVAVGATVAAFAAPVFIIGGRIAGELGNAWSKWQTGSIFNLFRIIALSSIGLLTKYASTPKGGPKPDEAEHLLGDSKDKDASGEKGIPLEDKSKNGQPEGSTPGSEAERLANQTATAEQAARDAEAARKRAEADDKKSTGQPTPAKAETGDADDLKLMDEDSLSRGPGAAPTTGTDLE